MVEDSTERDARLAAEMDADVGVEHIGRVYAEALLDAAENARAADALFDEFDSLVADVLEPVPRVRAAARPRA